MTKNEEFVRARYDFVTIEPYKSGKIKGLQTTYYLVWGRNRGDTRRHRLGEGKTKPQAWADAKQFLED